MELAVRSGADRFVAAGAYRALEGRLRERLGDASAVVLSCFDRRTRMLPFLFYDAHMFPLGPSLIAGALHQAGLPTRAVFELWNPRFRPSRARMDGRPPQILLLSSMQIHAGRAYAAVRDAHELGADRPLIICGGPKAVYEPYDFWSPAATGTRAAPDVVVAGEAYVLLELLEVVAAHRGGGESMRAAFERARRAGALADVPGLIYAAPGSSADEPALVDTGLQRLVDDLDELPAEFVGLSVLEPPHRGTGLCESPLPIPRVCRHVVVANLLMTQGCKFRCGYCPIPALHQKSWRHRSPEAVAQSMRILHERFGLKYFFGVDDNFFNRRETAEALLTGMTRAKAFGRPLGERVRFATEATQADTYKNRDLLPLARAAGMHSLWFGIEDLTASLIDKGQRPERTTELFRLMHEHKISPMAMLMFHDGQPFRSRGSLYGLANQVAFLRRAGAITVQCTVHTPAVGTREYESTYATGRVLASVGAYTIANADIDGNHVVVAGDTAAWKRQLQMWAGYALFYNPLNFIRACARDGSRLRNRRIGFQLFGMVTTALSAPRMLGYALRLGRGRPTYHAGPRPLSALPVEQASATPRYAAFSAPPPQRRERSALLG